jgi:hypothetical protein
VSQPPPYVPQHSFISDVTIGTFPGQSLDVEFNDVKATADQIRTNLARIQGVRSLGLCRRLSTRSRIQSNGSRQTCFSPARRPSSRIIP